MAKQNSDDPKTNQPSGNAGDVKKTQLSKKSPPPTQIAKQSSPPTQIAKKTGQHTQLSPEEGDQGPRTHHKMPKLSTDDEEVIEAEAADSGVVEAQPASDVGEGDDIFSGNASAGDAIFPSPPQTAIKAPETGAKAPETFHGMDSDDMVMFEAAAAEQSSAVDLGAKVHTPGGSSHAGIDEIAEELESGVKLEAATPKKPKKKPAPSVEFDDLVAHEGEAPSASAVKKKKQKEVSTDHEVDMAQDAEEAAAADLLDEDENRAPTIADEDGDVGKEARAAFAGEHETRTATDSDADVGEEAREALAGEMEAPSFTPMPSKKKEKVEDEEAAAEAVEADEEEAPVSTTRRGTAVAAAPARTRGGWLGGALLGLVLAAGGAGAAWYFDLIPASPNAAAPAKPITQPAQQAPKLSVAHQAHDQIDEGNYDEAIKLLENADKSPANLTTRAQARWLKYQKDQAAKTADLNKNDAEVSKALDDLDEAKNDIVKAQILKTIEHKALTNQIAGMKGNDKIVNDLRNKLAKAETKATQAEKQLSDAQKTIDDKQAALADVDKALADAKIKDAGSKGIAELLAAKKSADDKLAAVDKILADEKIKDTGVAGLKEVLATRNQLTKDRDDLDQAIRAAFKELADANFVPKGGDPRKQLLEGIKNARQRTESPLTVPLAQLGAALGGLGLNPARDAKNAFESAAVLAELNYYRLREPLIQSPEQKLDSYLAIYRERRPVAADEAATALKDAAWILSKEAKSTAAAKAKALTVTGLIARNQDKHAEAKQALEAAVATPATGTWTAQAKQALKELNEPALYYLPRIEQLQATGQLKAAQSELDSALKALPNDAKLHAQRGLLRLDEARRSSKIAPDDEASIRADADAALKDPKTASDGAYVLGQLEEELGNLDQAEKHFRQALKAHQGAPEEANRYRIGLARVLQRDRIPAYAPSVPPVAPPADPKKKDDKKAAPATGEVSQAYPLAAALVLGQAGAGELDPATEGRLNESTQIAKELIKSADPKIKGQGYMILGQALAKQGKRTEGIHEYLKGLALYSPGMTAKDMKAMLDDHPAFQQPDAVQSPSAYLAEVHFGKGLNLYWSRQYPEAESHFKQAAGFYSQDARYQYYLGLSQYAQQTKAKRDAANYSFEQGARLEAANRPSVSEINASLERVQGDLRKMINSFRTKAIELKN
jgi:tetratricopeptide (TPR) repeat protein